MLPWCPQGLTREIVRMLHCAALLPRFRVSTPIDPDHMGECDAAGARACERLRRETTR